MTTARMQYPNFDMSFRRLNLLGEGSFGKVYLGERISSANSVPQNENSNNSNQSNTMQMPQNMKDPPRELFALKKLKPYPRKKYTTPSISQIEDYPQVAIMQFLSHPNVLPLKGMVQLNKGFEMSHYMVLDFGIELLEFGKHKEVMLSRELVRCLLQQLTAAVYYLHTQGIMHRDIKPDNIYLMQDGTLKLGDFSIATPINKTAPSEMVEEGEEQYERTANVTTRHYRAPQIIYGSRGYDQSIDIWSFGCTIAQLLLGQPLFPGTTDIHQLELIFSVLGCPQDLWPSASELPYYLEFDNSKPPTGLKHILPDANSELLDFVESALQLDPRKRLSTSDLMKHEYLQPDTSSARQELSKMCCYLHGKKLREVLKGKQ